MKSLELPGNNKTRGAFNNVAARLTRVVHVCPLVEGSVRTGAGNCQEFVFLPYEIKFSFSRHLGFKS
jgi:hypothetical protein